MKNKRLINSSYLLYKHNKLSNRQFSIDSLNFSSSRRKTKSFRYKDKLTRPSSSSSIFSQKRLNFLNEQHKVNTNKNISLNVLDLLLENNPYKYSYRKLKNKISTMDHFYRNDSMRSTNNVKEVYYKYNVLYGQNTSNLIRTY